MESRDWLLVFPPLISSNWGNYYPSIALLDAVLRDADVSARQLDLNEEFLDYLIEPTRLRGIDEGFRRRGRTPPEEVPQRAAARLLLRHPEWVVNGRGQHVCDGDWNGLDLTVELSRPFHLDVPVPELTRGFPGSELAASYRRFFEASSLPDALAETGQAVGVSIPMGPQLGPSVVLAKLAKEWRPDLKVVFGGPTMTLMAPELLRGLLDELPEVDAVVRYEGEEPLRQLAGQLRNGAWAPGSIPSVTVPGTGGSAPVCRTSRSLGGLPFPNFAPEILNRLENPRVGVLQARGCYWGKCSYCDFIELFSNENRYAGRAAGALFQEIDRLAGREGIRRFWLITEALPPVQAKRFAESVLERGLEIDWRSFAMVDERFTVEILRACHESGCTGLTIGLETMADRVLALVEKQADREANLRFFEKVRASGLKIGINLIPNLPSTTYDEAMDTLDVIAPYHDIFRTVAVFPFEATSSSAVGRDPERFGLRVLDDVGRGQAQFSSNTLAVEDPAMTADERERVLAAYDAFARTAGRSRPRKEETAPRDAAAGVRFRSERITVFEDKEASVIYDWDRDRIWRMPAGVIGGLRRLEEGPGPVRLGELANALVGSVGIPSVPSCTLDLVRELEDHELVTHASA